LLKPKQPALAPRRANTSLQRTRRQSLRSFLLAAELDIVRPPNVKHVFLPAAALLVAAICALGAPALTPFAHGKAEVHIPAGYAVSSRPDGTLVATFGPRRDHKLELTLHDHSAEPGPPDLAERFVREQAKKKNRNVNAGAGKVVLMEQGPDTRVGSLVFRTVHWQVAFGKSLVVMTLTAPIGEPMSPALQEFLDKHLNALVVSMQRKAV
jgi:hypothetical protein